MKEYLEYKTKRTHKFCEFWNEENKTFIREGGLNIEEAIIIKEYRTLELAEEKISDLYQKLLKKGYESPLVQLDILMEFDVLGLEKLDLASELIKEKVLKINGRAIEYICFPSDELKHIAVKNNGTALEFIENPSEDMEVEAIKSNAMALKFIENQTEEIKDIALNSAKIFFAHVYFKNPTNKTIVSFLNTGISLRDINPYFKIEDINIALEAINVKYNNYNYLPDEFKNNNVIAEQLLVKDSKNLHLLNSTFRNSEEFVMLVLENEKFIPDDYFLQDLGSDLQENKELVIKVVAKNGLTLELAKSNFREDKEVVIAAISQNINALIFVKKKMYKIKDIRLIIEENKHKSHWMEVVNL